MFMAQQKQGAQGVPATRLGGLFLFLLAAQFLTVIMLAASIAPGYDMYGGKISDLGVIVETAMLFNLSVIAVGALNIAGGYLFYRSHRKASVLSLYLIAGVGAIGVGLFPLNTGGAHGLFALIAFVSFNLEAIATATVVRGPLKWISAIAGAIGLVYVVLMAFGDGGNAAAFGPIGHGGTERMIVYPAMLWLLVLGGALMGTERDR